MYCHFRKTILTLTVLFLFASPGLATAEKIVIGTDDYPPFTSQKGNRNNCLVEVLHTIGEEMGVTFEIRFLPWERNLNYVEMGKIWGGLSVHQKQNKERTLCFFRASNQGRDQILLLQPRRLESWHSHRQLLRPEAIPNRGSYRFFLYRYIQRCWN